MKKIKKILFLLTIIMLLSVGCSKAEEDVSEDTASEEEQISEEQTSEENASEKEEELTDIFIEGKYFNITLPANWKDKYIMEEYEDEYGYSMEFCEKSSNDIGYVGWLFSIEIWEGEIQQPNYEEIGKINIDGEEYPMIIAYPTDVQFTEETSEAYHELGKDIETIIDTIDIRE